MQKKIDALTQEYHSIKSQNLKFKNAIRRHNKDVKRLQDFLHNQFTSIEPFKAINSLYKVIKPKDKSHVTFLSVVNGVLTIKIQTNDNAIKYLKRFNSLPYFTDIILQNTYHPVNTEKIITFTMKLKSRHE